MTRRIWAAVPAMLALATRRVFAQSAPAPALAAKSPAAVSKKSLIKFSRLKAAYKLPKTAAKEAKHLATLSALLSLTPEQLNQAESIFDSAVKTRASLHTSLKAARQSLHQAVGANDPAGIQQASGQIASLKAEQVANGALMNSAFLQILTTDQRALVAQVQS